MTKRDEMNAALREFKQQRSHAEMRDVLKRVAGVTIGSEVPDNRIDAVIAALKSVPTPGPQTLDEIRILAYAKWNTEWQRPDGQPS